MRIAVIGMGYVGCVTAACLARDGHKVVGVDVDESKVKAINAGVSPIFEPGLDTLLRQQVESERLLATTNLLEVIEDCEVALIAVGTPSDDDGSVNYKIVLRVIESIGNALRDSKHNLSVVVRSTLLPGVLEDVLIPALAEAANCEIGDRISICSNPEFLRETTAISDYDNPPYVLIGAKDKQTAAVALQLYEKLTCEKIVTDTRVAAMIKYSCNTFHALKVSFANEIGALAKSFGADGHKVMDIVCKDRQLNISAAYLRPGFAFGGSCLPKDVRALTRYAQQQGIECNLLSSLLPSNQSHLARAIRLVQESDAKNVGLIGLSFKAGTDDLRESPQVMLAQALLGLGYNLRIFDPGVRVTALVGSNLHYIDEHLPHLARLLCNDSAELLDHSELIIVSTSVVDHVENLDKFTGNVIDLRKDLVAECLAPELSTL